MRSLRWSTWIIIDQTWGLLGVCFVAEDPKEREHLRQIFSEAAAKLSPIKLRHGDRSLDGGENRLKDGLT